MNDQDTPEQSKKDPARQVTHPETLTDEPLGKLGAVEASLLKAIPHAVLGLRERTIVFANDGVETVFGWKPEELIGKSTRVLYRTEEEYEAVGRRGYPVLARQDTYSEELPCRHKDGREIICRLSTARAGGSLRAKQVVVVYEDITGQVTA